MKALTVQQPWAWAIVHGGKTVENRTQAWGYRGPLAIHAGLAKPNQHNLASRRHRLAHGTEVPTELHFGAIVGMADLVDVHVGQPERIGGNGLRIEVCCASPWAEFADGPTKPVVHLVLANPRPLAVPVPCRGALGLWTVTAGIDDQVELQLEGSGR